MRLFLNEYDGIPLEEFCKAKKVSYNKMLNCLGHTSHQHHPVNKPKTAKPVNEGTADNPLLPTLALREFVVDMPDAPEKSDEDSSRVAQISNPKPTKVSRLIKNISISINSRIGVNIGKCDVTTLSALIREMKVSL